MIKSIIFDFDGTIADTNKLVLDSWQHTYRYYFGHEYDERRILASFGEPLLETLAREIPGVPPEESVEIYREYQFKYANPDAVKPFPGIIEMVKELHGMGYKLAIVTSRTGDSLEKYLKLADIKGYFDAYVSCYDTTVHKPNPEPLLLGMEKLGTVPEETIYIGDTPIDMKCANNANVKSVFVAWSEVSKADFRYLPENAKGYVADYVIQEPKDLLEILKLC